MTSILQCPVCRKPLLLSADGYQCAANHAFDAAKQGYVNLLLAHKKNSREPGDNPDMVQSRRRFLDRGHYDQVSDAINRTVGSTLAGSSQGNEPRILDAGCGEGFYLKRLKDALALNTAERSAINYFGVDISKSAVRAATQRDKSVDWFVASINELPFADDCLDIVLNVFSPANAAEFARTLKESGSLVVVTPGPKHLNGLREVIYPVVREHGEASIAEKTKGIFTESFVSRVTYPLELASNQEIMDLLSMTPYFWNIDRATKAKVEALNRLMLDVDVEIRVFRKDVHKADAAPA